MYQYYDVAPFDPKSERAQYGNNQKGGKDKKGKNSRENGKGEKGRGGY